MNMCVLIALFLSVYKSIHPPSFPPSRPPSLLPYLSRIFRWLILMQKPPIGRAFKISTATESTSASGTIGG